MSNLTNKTTKALLVTLALSLLLLPQVFSQDSIESEEEQEMTKKKIPMRLGVGFNVLSLFGNYPALNISANLQVNNYWSIEIGGAPLFASETWAANYEENTAAIAPHIRMLEDLDGGEAVEHDRGYRLFGEAKYYILDGRHQPFFGLGYSYVNTNYKLNYVMRLEDEASDQRYYRNVMQEYESTVNTVYLMIGYRLTSSNERMFMEMGVNLRRKQKEVSPRVTSAYDGTVVTNEYFFNDYDRFPLPVSFDLKLGILLFK